MRTASVLSQGGKSNRLATTVFPCNSWWPPLQCLSREPPPTSQPSLHSREDGLQASRPFRDTPGMNCLLQARVDKITDDEDEGEGERISGGR